MVMQTKAYRLLLIDSRAIYRRGLRALLKKVPDLDVVGEAADSPTALERAREVQPDVVLIDLHFPGCDVVQTIAQLRQDVPGVNIVVLSGKEEEPSLVLQAIRAGARGCVSQDSEVEELMKAIRLVTRGQAVLGPESLTGLISLITQSEMPIDQSREPDRLTSREREVLGLVALGRTNREIAQRLFVSESTVRSHIHNILDKLQLANRVQAAAFALAQR